MVTSAWRSALFPERGVAPVTTTVMSGWFSTSKYSALRRCSSRLPMPDDNDAVRMSMRPETVPAASSLPLPDTSGNRTVTGNRPQKLRLLTTTDERSGARFHTPAFAASARTSFSPGITGSSVRRLSVHQ
jgi:hypothetical protein